MKLKTLCLTFAVALGSVTSTAGAHHSIAPLDMNKTIDVKGILRSVDYINPHCEFRLDSKDAKGTTISWLFESSPPGHLRRAGIKKSDFTKGIGQEVTITAHPARDGSLFGYLRTVTFGDGTSVTFESPSPESLNLKL